MIVAPRRVVAGPAPAGRRTLTVLFGVWTVLTVACVSVPFTQGLRGRYFEGLDASAAPAHMARDREISTPWIAFRWWFVAPKAFSAQWNGYLVVDRPGLYTFQTISDDAAQLRIDQQLVIDNPGGPGTNVSAGMIQLDRGAHRLLLESSQRRGSYLFEWSWSRDGEALAPIPPWALSMTRRDPWVVDLMRSLPWLWLAVTVVGVIAALWLAWRSAPRRRLARSQVARAAAAAVCAAAVAGFYMVGATEHGRRVNTFKARADQSGYLRDAQEVFANWHGQQPPGLVGMRNRMPVYAAFQALFWDPRLSNDEFFERAKQWNIRLSLLLLVVLGLIFYASLPALIATNLLLIVAFGVFIFKAAYTQAELLFYSLFFMTFLACCQLLRQRSSTPVALLLLGAAAGALAGVTHLTKAAALPLAVIFAVVYCGREAILLLDRRAHGGAAASPAYPPAKWRLAAGAAMLAAFISTLYPYISTNKRVFGEYFYNVNTTFYIWYDDWSDASVGTALHGDHLGWPTMPPSQIPSMTKYLKTHTVANILQRFEGGVHDMVVRSYDTFWYSKYVLLYTVFAGMLIAANRQPAAAMIARQWPVFTFLVLYAGTYLPAIAFYAPISGTGTTRFLLAHLMPLMFTLSCLFARLPFRETRWRIGGVTIVPAHFHLLVVVTIGLDLTFTLWPRLMSTYGGF